LHLVMHPMYFLISWASKLVPELRGPRFALLPTVWFFPYPSWLLQYKLWEIFIGNNYFLSSLGGGLLSFIVTGPQSHKWTFIACYIKTMSWATGIAKNRRIRTSNFYLTINSNKHAVLVDQLTPEEEAYLKKLETAWRSYFDQSPDACFLKTTQGQPLSLLTLHYLTISSGQLLISAPSLT